MVILEVVLTGAVNLDLGLNVKCIITDHILSMRVNNILPGKG